jgi:hypothetical protein
MSQTDLDEILTRGGAHRVALLQYCVLSVTMEPLFVYLVGDFRLRPTLVGALAIYDLFCAARAPGRIRAPDVLPPQNLRLTADVEAARRRWTELHAGDAEPNGRSTPSITLHGHLFDTVFARVRNDPDGPFMRVRRSYDARLTPAQNLPGGRMSPSQRQFRDETWLPFIRPQLVAAGFWQVASIG